MLDQHLLRRLACLLLAGPCCAHEWTAPAVPGEVRQADGSRAQANQPTHTVRLQVRLHEGGTPAPVAGLIRVTPLTAGAEPLRLAGLFERPAGWFSMPPEATLALPPGRHRVEAVRGLDTLVAEATVDGVAGRVVELALTPVRFTASGRHRRSANTHLHLLLRSRLKMGVDLADRQEADAYLRTVGACDGLDLAYVSYLTAPGVEVVSNEYTDADLGGLSDGPTRFAPGVEHRHAGRRIPADPAPAAAGAEGAQSYASDNSTPAMSYGHVLLLGLAQRTMLASIGPGLAADATSTDGVPLRQGIAAARVQGGGVVWCHGSQGLERIPGWLAGLLDAQNIYDGGNEGTFETVYYPVLNAGLKVPFSTGTDWGVWDFSRVCVDLPGPLTSQAFLRELAAGRTFITNEPLLEFAVDDAVPGGSVHLAASGRVRVRGRAEGRSDFLRLQVVRNGRVVHEAACRPVGGHFAAEVDLSLPVDESGWIALRIPPAMPYAIRSRYTGPGVNILGKAIFAHTSPVYLEVAGRPRRDPAAIGTLLAAVEASLARIDEVGVFADAAERAAVRAIYLEAAAVLRALPTDAGASRSSPPD